MLGVSLREASRRGQTRPVFVYNMPMAETPLTVSPTVRTHRRQFVWQILAPFLVMAGLVIAAAVLTNHEHLVSFDQGFRQLLRPHQLTLLRS